MIEMVSLIGLVIGVHGLLHLGLESVYGFNPMIHLFHIFHLWERWSQKHRDWIYYRRGAENLGSPLSTWTRTPSFPPRQSPELIQSGSCIASRDTSATTSWSVPDCSNDSTSSPIWERACSRNNW
jgi:hypothetical protein